MSSDWPARGQRPSADASAEALSLLGAAPLFEKVLTQSDVMGRIVIPLKYAQAHLPQLDSQERLDLQLFDIWGDPHYAQLHFWKNLASRQYILEARSVLRAYLLEAGDVLSFSELALEGMPCPMMLVCGRQGTQAGAAQARRPASKGARAQRPPDLGPVPAETQQQQQQQQQQQPAAQLKRAAQQRRWQERHTPQQQPPEGVSLPQAVDSGEAAGQSQVITQPVQPAQPPSVLAPLTEEEVRDTYTFWSTQPRVDEIFRAVEGGTEKLPVNQVLYSPVDNCYAVITCLGGEYFQAFYHSTRAAHSALDALVQSSHANQGDCGSGGATQQHASLQQPADDAVEDDSLPCSSGSQDLQSASILPHTSGSEDDNEDGKTCAAGKQPQTPGWLLGSAGEEAAAAAEGLLGLLSSPPPVEPDPLLQRPLGGELPARTLSSLPARGRPRRLEASTQWQSSQLAQQQPRGQEPSSNSGATAAAAPAEPLSRAGSRVPANLRSASATSARSAGAGGRGSEGARRPPGACTGIAGGLPEEQGICRSLRRKAPSCYDDYVCDDLWPDTRRRRFATDSHGSPQPARRTAAAQRPPPGAQQRPPAAAAASVGKAMPPFGTSQSAPLSPAPLAQLKVPAQLEETTAADAADAPTAPNSSQHHHHQQQQQQQQQDQQQHTPAAGPGAQGGDTAAMLPDSSFFGLLGGAAARAALPPSGGPPPVPANPAALAQQELASLAWLHQLGLSTAQEQGNVLLRALEQQEQLSLGQPW